MNVIHASAAAGVEKLLFIGSSCIYPKFSPQPITEEALLTGPLEPTNQWYAIAKIAGLKLCEAYRRQRGCDFIAAMPTNLYGPGDNFDPTSGHVIPGLLAKPMKPKRPAPTNSSSGVQAHRDANSFMSTNADALVHLMTHYSGESHVNVGSGSDLTIFELATLIADAVEFAEGLQPTPLSPTARRASSWIQANSEASVGTRG